MLLVIDNYDSFTFNLVQYFGELGADVQVIKNDELTVDQIAALRPNHLVISPGPCTPNEAGVSLAVIKRLSPHVPTLGVCLGHQAIGQAFGGRVVRAQKPVHGKTSPIFHDGKDLFAALPNPMVATRYHSLIVEKESLPNCLVVNAKTWEEEIMALRHVEHPIWGVQFHPESILTTEGKRLLANFLSL